MEIDQPISKQNLDSATKPPKLSILHKLQTSIIILSLLLSGCSSKKSTADILESIKDPERNTLIFHDETNQYSFPLNLIYQKLFETEQIKTFNIVKDKDDETPEAYCDIILLPKVQIWRNGNQNDIQQVGGTYLKPGSSININGTVYTAHPERGLVISTNDSASHEIIHCAINDELSSNTKGNEQNFAHSVDTNDNTNISFYTFNHKTYLIIGVKDYKTEETYYAQSYFFDEVYTQILTKYIYKVGLNNTSTFNPELLNIDDFNSNHPYDKATHDILKITAKYQLKYKGEQIDITVLQKLLANELTQGGSEAVFNKLIESKKGSSEYEALLKELSQTFISLQERLYPK